MISLLLHKSEDEDYINNQNIISIHLVFFIQITLPINASFVKQQTMALGYLHLAHINDIIFPLIFS